MDEFMTPIDNSSMSHIHDLLTRLLVNNAQIENITVNIKKMEADVTNANDLETLYKNEFFLFMENIGLYEDLIIYIDKEPKTIDNELELARIKKTADNLVLVEVMEF